MSSSIFIAFTLLLAWLTRHLYRKFIASPRPSLPLPPGPKLLPFLGNLFDMPTSREYVTYGQWGKEHGDIVHVGIPGQHIIILNSIEAVTELFDQRSTIYSDRPYIPMIHEPTLMDTGWTFVIKPYSSAWRRQRRLFVQHLDPATIHTFFEKQTASTHTLLRSILSTPSGYLAHVRHAAADMIMGTTYGYEVKLKDDPFVELAERAVRDISQAISPGACMVNIFPWLKHVPSWFPGASFKTFAEKSRKLSHDTIRLPFEDFKKRMAEGTASPCFVGSALADLDDNSTPELVRDIQEVAATMYGAAADTTSGTLHSCILGLVLNPSVQDHAHAELDAVLGAPTSTTFRLPTFDDRPMLPYIEAILKESLRWMNIVVTGVPHSTTQEDVYRGWRIPKGSIVIANTWGLLHDDKRYANPSVFRPERFIRTETNEAEPDPAFIGAFGYGRRICPGQQFAEGSLWIEIASLLSVFTFSSARDEMGNEISVEYATAHTPGVLGHPQPFPCLIKPRSSEAAARICETELSAFGGATWTSLAH